MSEYRVSTYDTTCTSFHRLRDALGARGIRPYDSEYRYREGDIIINWGLSGNRHYPVHINIPFAVGTGVHKLRAFQAFDRNHVPHPVYTSDPEVAFGWLASNHIIYARSTETGARGEGITILHPGRPMASSSQLPYAEFYSKQFPGDREFRVYVCGNTILQVYEKKALDKVGLDPLNRASEDWYYCKEYLAPYPDELLTVSLKAARAVGLDFTGVDILLNSDTQEVCVLEVNSAPWLGTGTAEKLARAIRTQFPL